MDKKHTAEEYTLESLSKEQLIDYIREYDYTRIVYNKKNGESCEEYIRAELGA